MAVGAVFGLPPFFARPACRTAAKAALPGGRKGRLYMWGPPATIGSPASRQAVMPPVTFVTRLKP